MTVSSNFRRLNVLKLGGSQIYLSGIVAILESVHLTSLSTRLLSDTCLQESHFANRPESLRSTCSIINLDLDHARNFKDADMMVLGKCPLLMKLRHLNLAHHNLNLAGIKALAKLLTLEIWLF